MLASEPKAVRFPHPRSHLPSTLHSLGREFQSGYKTLGMVYMWQGEGIGGESWWWKSPFGLTPSTRQPCSLCARMGRKNLEGMAGAHAGRSRDSLGTGKRGRPCPRYGPQAPSQVCLTGLDPVTSCSASPFP